MAKIKPDWTKAKAMYETGKSLRQIACETYIDNSNISKRAKKDGWVRTAEIPQLIVDAVSVQERITALDLPHKEIVTAEIKKQIDEAEKKRKHLEFLENSTYQNLTHMMKKVIPHKDKKGNVIDPEASISEHVQAQNALNKGAELLAGKNPDTVINNTNAQQNNSSDVLKEIAERLPV
jgi:hypothetical protein